VVTELGSLSDGLESIRQALGSGLQQLLAPEEAEPAPEPRPLQASFAPETLGVMKEMVDELRTTLVEQPRPEPAKVDLPPQEIQVVSKVPSAILNVLRQQFRLMEGWLAPREKEASISNLSMPAITVLTAPAFSAPVPRSAGTVHSVATPAENLEVNPFIPRKPRSIGGNRS